MRHGSLNPVLGAFSHTAQEQNSKSINDIRQVLNGKLHDSDAHQADTLRQREWTKRYKDRREAAVDVSKSIP